MVIFIGALNDGYYHLYLSEYFPLKHLHTWDALVVTEWTHISIHAMFASRSQAQIWPNIDKNEEYMRRWVYFQFSGKHGILMMNYYFQCFTFAKSYRNYRMTQLWRYHYVMCPLGCHIANDPVETMSTPEPMSTLSTIEASGMYISIKGEAYITSGRQQLTYCGLETPYGAIDLGQHWLR